MSSVPSLPRNALNSAASIGQSKGSSEPLSDLQVLQNSVKAEKQLANEAAQKRGALAQVAKKELSEFNKRQHQIKLEMSKLLGAYRRHDTNCRDAQMQIDQLRRNG